MDEAVCGKDSGLEVRVAVAFAQDGYPSAQAHPVGAEAGPGVVGLPTQGQ